MTIETVKALADKLGNHVLKLSTDYAKGAERHGLELVRVFDGASRPVIRLQDADEAKLEERFLEAFDLYLTHYNVVLNQCKDGLSKACSERSIEMTDALELPAKDASKDAEQEAA